MSDDTDALRPHGPFPIRVESLLAAAGEGIYGLDLDGRTTFVNPAAAAMLGYEPHELLGRSQHAAIHHTRPDGSAYPRDACPIYAALTDGEVHRVRDDVFWRKDGSSFPVEYTSTPIVEDGRIVGGVVTFKDISVELEAAARERQLVEERVALEEAASARVRIRTILESITDAFFAFDHDWRFTWLNDAAERILGRERHSLLGKVVWDEYPEAVGSDYQVMYERALATGRSVEFETYHDEAEVWFQVRAFPSTDGMSVYLRDITETRLAEEALRASEARYRFLSEAIPQQIWTSLPDGQLDWVSRQVLEYFDRPEADIIGDGWQNVIHPEELPTIVRRWSASLESGDDYEVEFRLLRHDGAYRWHLGRAVAQKDAEGRVLKWFGTNTDIHDRKEAEAARDEVLGIVSHDLRNPLNVILTAAALLLEIDLDATKRRGQFETIQRAGRSMSRLIDDLLDVTRMDAGRLTLERRPIRAGRLVTDVEALMAPLAADKGVEFVCRGDDATDWIEVDPDRMLQVFSNLVGNAVRLTPAGGRIEVALSVADGTLDVSVTDTGPGISAEHLPHLFERFWQGRRGGRDGAGLGLPIARGLVEAHGGRLDVESVEGEGATFRVVVPPPRNDG